jgi:hypothetical protein
MRLSVVAIALFSLETRAQIIFSESFSSSACDLRNIGNGKARDGFIRDNGAVSSILDKNNIPIYCPIPKDALSSKISVAIMAGNLANVSRKFSCVLSEYDLFNFKVRSIRRAVTVAPGFGQPLFFDQIQLDSWLNYVELRCELPPGGSYGAIAVDNYL